MHAFSLTLGVLLAALGGDWTYVPRDEGVARARPRALALSDACPDDVAEEVDYRGARRRYAQLRYGRLDSIRVAVVLDVLTETEADLYVDADRDRTVEPSDRVAPSGDREWRVALTAAETPVGGGPERVVVLHRSRGGEVLSVRTAGRLEGTAQVGEREVAALRVDGDGNGFFSDEHDRIWLDLDGDLRFDPLAEQFAYDTFLRIGRDRWVVRGDPGGRWLGLDALAGTGTVTCRAGGVKGSQVTDFQATLVARDGSPVLVRVADEGVEVPTGDYRLGTVAFTLRAEDGGSASYVFSDRDRLRARWFAVEEDAQATIDVVGSVEFGVDTSPVRDECLPGDRLQARPFLRTETGLEITTSSCRPALVALEDASGKRLATASSGFA